ncbi:hypothetical protein [Desulfosporosinus hippei]|uniref:Uncharacterized protein n=1 Tax=Desulfosporosinus hippei DSM 8344 TaxID=1121419 RepID=A0A1G8FN18_9FIRM|nr:hypothetical protein [Desulfosporosinus hippei]SDH83563.1 hypothetical protein SAMN05443529_12022 [Desulfosporosinus hippei DSM 8344]
MHQTKTYKVTVIEDCENNSEQQNNNSSDSRLNYDALDEIKQIREEDKRLFDLTSISECLNIAMHEYDLERNKKQSFDNRAGIIIPVFAAIGIAIYNIISVKDIIHSMSQPITFVLLLQIVTGLMAYFSLISSFVFAVNVISVKPFENFDIKIIDSQFISMAKIQSGSKLLEVYLNLVRIHRKRNEQTAKMLARSQWSMIISIILIMAYLILK